MKLSEYRQKYLMQNRKRNPFIGKSNNKNFTPPKDTAEVRKERNRFTAPRLPNSTEKKYNLLHLGGQGMYEAVTLHLAGGSRYTPDFVTWDESGKMTCHEVKGSYRLPSESRAATAFRECIARFPNILFVWACENEDGTFSIERIG